MSDESWAITISLLVGALLFCLGGAVGDMTSGPELTDTVCVAYSPSTGECSKSMTIQELIEEVGQ